MNESITDFRKLSLAERIQLVEDMWDSIAEDSTEGLELTAGQRQELQRRIDAHDADPSTGLHWEEVRAELFKRNLE